MLQKTASIYVEAAPERVFDSLVVTMDRSIAGGSAGSILKGPSSRPSSASYSGDSGTYEYAFVLQPVGTGTQLQLTYTMPRTSSWNLGARTAMSTAVPGQLNGALQMVKTEAEAPQASSTPAPSAAGHSL